jgi:hypothetical protein
MEFVQRISRDEIATSRFAPAFFLFSVLIATT